MALISPIIPFYRQEDLMIVSSEGCRLRSAQGRRYVDFESGDWAANLGHSHARILRALMQQAGTLVHDGLRFRNRPSEDLATRLLEKLSFAGGGCAFLNSGSEAVDLGIRLARHLTGRTKVLKLDCSYLAAFGHGQICESNCDLVDIPMEDHCALSRLDPREIAVFVLEPGNAWGTVRFPSSGFVRAIASAVQSGGGLLMSNEVTTGLGRTGRWFGFQHYDFQPDIVSLGKALGNGYPVSCLATTAEILSRFTASPFRYAQSHQNDPLGCAVAIEVLKVMDEEALVGQSAEKGSIFLDALGALRSRHPGRIQDVRGRGLMLALELAPGLEAEEIASRLLERGFLVGFKGRSLRFMPPLIIERREIESLACAIDGILAEMP